MKITHSTKVKASEDNEYITDSYERQVHAPKPAGGDGKNYISYYTGHGYAGPKEILEDAKQRGFSKMYWGSDEAYGMHGMYNGDMYIAYNNAEVLPKGYKEDALDAEAHNRVMSCSDIEGATQEEMQKAFDDYYKKQQNMISQLDDLQDNVLKKSKPKKRGLFKRAFASDENPVCHKVNEDDNSIDYIVSTQDIDCKKWMGTYLTPEGKVKKVYFCFDSDDWNEAAQELEDIIPEPYQSCKLLGTAPNTIESDDEFMLIENTTKIKANQTSSNIENDLRNEIHRWLVDVGGFDEEYNPDDRYSMPADEMFVVEMRNEDNATVAEVRAELGYSSMDKLADVLNEKVLSKYDSNAYFEQVEPGIMEAYIYNNIEGSTEVTAASPVSDTRDHWLEAEDDDLEEIPTYQETIEVEIDAEIEIEDDGSYDYDSYDFAKDHTSSGDYYISYDALATKTRLRDYIGVVEDIDELLMYKLPDVKGKHHISGLAELVYDVDGLVRDNSDGLVYPYDVTVTFNRADSEIKRFHID